MTRSAFRLSLLALPLAALIACAERPDLSGRIASADTSLPWPSLISTPALAPVDNDTAYDGAVQSATTTEARARALTARAQTLSTTAVLNETDRARLLATLARNN
ncbi:hypothetical protein [Celeribacter persicus]|uniref:Beta-barrel assembly complex subunit BamF n=1 Tax=Celeribacter persicus TaxID=1651082 RepID=A0A2T5HI81_9RHOB|nr:hypothetical protein [Celeribacter persicus]PTQ71281.1 hypothetical protein C8N42_10855 [Celeribacter persicus]